MHTLALDQLRTRMRESGLDGVLVANPVNLRYLTGFHSNAYSRPLTLLVPSDGEPTLVVPRLEELQAREMTRVADIRSYVEWDEGSRAGGELDAEWRALLVEAVAGRGFDHARLGLERAALGGAREAGLAAALPKATWVDVRTGHGLGLAPVEAPNLGAGDTTPLRAGMVISIEPGVCIPGVGGVLWADNYVVTETGVLALTAYPVQFG